MSGREGDWDTLAHTCSFNLGDLIGEEITWSALTDLDRHIASLGPLPGHCSGLLTTCSRMQHDHAHAPSLSPGHDPGLSTTCFTHAHIGVRRSTRSGHESCHLTTCFTPPEHMTQAC